MQNNIIRAGIALIAAAMLTTACNTNDDETQPISTSQSQTAQRTFTVSIPATFNGNSSLTKALTIGGTDDAPTAIGRFEESEKVYVYNKTNDFYLEGYLSPTNISSNGKNCTLSGTLTGDISADDELTLFYNMNVFYFDGPVVSCYFDYTFQSGTETDLLDGCMATGIKFESYESNTLTTDKPANFEPAQSVFRFMFKDEDGNAINVKTLFVKSQNDMIVTGLYHDGPVYNDAISLNLANASTNPYMSLCFANGNDNNDNLDFTVVDADGNVYKGTKAAPEGGFQNGFFYYNSEPIKVEKQRNLHHPTITWTSVDPYSTIPNEYNYYTVRGVYNSTTHSVDPPVFTIGGESEGFGFSCGGTITFDKLNATLDGNTPFFWGTNLNIEIKGTNEIDCSNCLCAIVCEEGEGVLKLSGEGTLKITCNKNTGGLCGQGYYNDECDPSVLAADGYTVTRTKKDNGDNTYTYTYQVYKSGAGGDQGGDPNGPDDF